MPKVVTKYVTRERRVLPYNKLGLNLQEFGALLAVREALRSKQIVHNPYLRDSNHSRVTREGYQIRNLIFNMREVITDAKCGTVGCIAGHMGLVMGKTPSESVGFFRSTDDADGRRRNLYYLFFPKDNKRRSYRTETWELIDNKMAVKAIDNFLATGKPNWEKVIGHNAVQDLDLWTNNNRSKERDRLRRARKAA